MGKYPPCPPSPPSSNKIMFLLYLNMKNNIFFHFGLYWPSTPFVGLFGLFWPLMSFLSQKIPFWVKIKWKSSLSTNQMLKTVFEAYESLWFTVMHTWYIRFLVRPAWKESKVPKLKSLTVKSIYCGLIEYRCTIVHMRKWLVPRKSKRNTWFISCQAIQIYSLGWKGKWDQSIGHPIFWSVSMSIIII